ncbi:MAG: FAD-linked oxidase C-terminal domain-containing protein [Gammaproteobacteria bacterium]|nr:FAD-linked oxidase C-terminal domain-containing protein [Gammaproteobacteria bacterium]
MPNRSEIPTLFSDCLPKNNILTSTETLRPYECDGYTAYKSLPLAVLLPETTQQVIDIIKTCQSESIPIVTRGAGTGLSGGAHPISNGILLNLSKLNEILEINHELQYAHVGPGVRNLAISDAASEFGLYYAPDPSSQIACTIGGNIAENSGGVHCLKYGLTVHNLLEITFVTIDGELITIGSECYENPGYDILALLTGSEGMLAIMVEAKVKLLPKPTNKEVILAAFNKVEDAGNAVAAIIAGGVIPAGLEMMDNAIISAAENFCHAGYPTDAAAILLCELDGYGDSLQWEIDQVTEQCNLANAVSVHKAEDADEQELFWKGRKSAFPAIGQLTPDYLCMDGTIPRKHLAHVLSEISNYSKEIGLAVANVFHAGDGNLHPLIMYDANNLGELEKAEQIGGKILELCVSVGGTITGEHGVGIEKLNQMCVQFKREELNQFERIKESFDPTHLLNPGKVIPTLQRCAEFGKMHVHHGEMPFKDLPRF